MNIVLQRTAQPDALGTEGLMTLPDGSVLHTLELPWVPDPTRPGGMQKVSCVPPGTYALELHNTEKHPHTFALVNRELNVIHEPDSAYPYARTACLIHVANYVHELEGCIGVGMRANALGGECNISDSAVALAKLDEVVPWTTGHTLEILPIPTP